jgi:two-component system C4-dicarboxylate transport response regulator DctD
LAQASILIVDDEADLKGVIRKGLEISGFDVNSECDPTEALAHFQAGKYDMAILDVKMPNIDGFELYERLKQADRSLKVCFLTAFDVEYFDMFKQKFPDLPTQCFVRKPVSIISLIKMVKAELDIE